jgi:hypothetical protein
MRQRGPELTSLAQLDDLRALTADTGPYLSLYLSLRPATEELALATSLKWQEACKRAADAGAPAALLDTVDTWVEGSHREGAGLCVVATPAGPALVEHLERSPAFELVRWEVTPTLTPLLAARQRRQPHVLVQVDRQGADVTVGRGQATVTELSLHGRKYPLSKVYPSGRSQRRIQQRAEETWHRNMHAVAEDVVALARDTDARIVAIGGDQDAVGLIEDQLPEDVRDLVQPISVTRAADGSVSRTDNELDAVLDRWVDDEIARTVETYHEELGKRDRATASAADTLDALRASRVALLLVELQADDTSRAWLGDAADQVFLTVAELAALSVAPAEGAGSPSAAGSDRTAPLLDAAVSAALTTGAEVLVLPADGRVPGGIGALLRW